MPFWPTNEELFSDDVQPPTAAELMQRMGMTFAPEFLARLRHPRPAECIADRTYCAGPEPFTIHIAAATKPACAPPKPQT